MVSEICKGTHNFVAQSFTLNLVKGYTSDEAATKGDHKQNLEKKTNPMCFILIIGGPDQHLNVKEIIHPKFF